jgi:hypothetical protein
MGVVADMFWPYEIMVDPTHSASISHERKSWCCENIGVPGKAWKVSWEHLPVADRTVDVFKFKLERDLILFSLRWS